jgi:hypothetical protein
MKSFNYKFNLSFSSEETVFNPSTSHVSKKDYCNIWRLKFNVEKNKIVFFSQGRPPNNLQFNFNRKQLEIVDEFNYSGVLLTKKMVILINQTTDL